jgi:hypothetical protein
VATSGVKYVSVRFGDGTRTLYGTRFVHVYGRGSFTVTVTAVDAAGNQAVLTRRLVVRR